MGRNLRDGIIVLDCYTDDDIAAHIAGEDEETARRFGWWPQTSTPDGVRETFARWGREWETGSPSRTFAVREQATGRLVGGCELRRQPDGSAHISYWTSAAERGQGYATRSAVLLLEYARSTGISHVEAHVAADNHPSRRVVEKAGFCSAGGYTEQDGTEMIRYEIHLTNPGRPAGFTGG